MESWPYDLCQVANDDHEIDDGDNTRRTGIEPGYVHTRRRAVQVMKVRRFAVAVAEDDVAAFRAWVELNGNSFFRFTDPEDKMSRLCRVQGGRIPLRRAEDRLLPGGLKYYRGTAALESFGAGEPPAEVA